jgi:hypothetical protein
MSALGVKRTSWLLAWPAPRRRAEPMARFDQCLNNIYSITPWAMRKYLSPVIFYRCDMAREPSSFVVLSIASTAALRTEPALTIRRIIDLAACAGRYQVADAK